MNNFIKQEILVMKLIKQFFASLLLAGLAFASTNTFAIQITQLGFILDASGSVSAANYNLLRNGLSDALAVLDLDGSVEITITSYSSSTSTVVAPTVLTAATLPTIQNAIASHVKSGGTTDTAGAIRYTTNLMTASSIFSDASLRASIINLATDGVPNSQSAAEAAGLYAFNAGIDALSIEAIGSGVSSASALNNMAKIAFPGPATILGLNATTIPNPLGKSWVVPVSDFDALAPVLKAKVIASVKPVDVPESSGLALLVIGLFGLVVARKRVR
jgi:hypothetical protein